MRLTRRSFLKTGGAALTLLAGEAQAQAAWRWLPGLVAPLTEDSPFTAPQSPDIDLIAHTLNRTSFGMTGGDYARVKALAPEPEAALKQYLEEQLSSKTEESKALRFTIRHLEVLQEPVGELYEYKDDILLRMMLRATLLRAVYARRQLYEVMVQFWTDHFNIDQSKGECKWLKAADDRDVIRAHALGDFPAMLRASALSPAMLWYLDGRVNRKAEGDSKPNENYARELLELHTLGVHGGYTQSDVMEVARCLTGWTVRDKDRFFKGRVEFDADQHDDGVKQVLGETISAGLGRDDLTRVLGIVALHPATAKHLATKLCRRFIADEPHAAAVSAVAQSFLTSKGDIPTTLMTLFTTAEFRAARGTKLRRPFEFIVATLRAVRAETDGGQGLTDYLLRMGHAPFHYPTPDGYPVESEPWLATLLWRWNFAVALTEQRIPGTRCDFARLKQQAGGEAAVMAALLGRQAQVAEREAYHASGNGLALLLASPAFQYC
ncbi:MAG: DUF1800 domain-containing protein [Alphaproteobacteria bacterium]|nr:DUF1800 domain-containing protein [Alphaproteobacteria bacterium]